ncbi:hypothetical protein G9A89_012791 [Geosiphon pyriformis]|nr:hypothetical protein G9A89_012791 [Geosiphon pyriformis]
MAIELVQRIEDNQRMHLRSIFPVFASALIMAPAPQMAAIFFVAQTPDPNEQLINRLTANLVWLLESLAQAPQQSLYQRQQNYGPPVYYCYELTGNFSRNCNNSPLPSPAPRNNNNQNNRTINNNVSNQRPNHANINFFGEDLLVKVTGESASQPEENLFFTFNLIDDDHNMNKLAINTSELTKKKKKTKVDFVLNPKKASTSTADNNEPPKTKLEFPEIVQKSGPYSVVKDFMKTLAHIIFGQLMTHLQFRKNLCKSLIPKKKTPKTNKHFCQAGLANNSNVTLLICKAQVAGYFIDLILDNELSVSVIAKHFLEAIGRKIDESSIWPITNVHGDKKKGLSIAKAVSVRINDISIETDMEVFETKEYIIIVDNKWLKKAKALLDYELCKLTIRCGEKPIVNQKEKQSDKLNNNESDDKKNQEEQKKTAEFAYTIFISNDKSLNNVKADKEEIIVNSKLICWPYYDILRRTFDRKPGKKAKYNWEPISLITQEELKEVQKFFKSEPPEIQLLIVKQKEPSSEERKVDIKNLLARNSPVISKKGDTPG